MRMRRTRRRRRRRRRRRLAREGRREGRRSKSERRGDNDADGSARKGWRGREGKCRRSKASSRASTSEAVEFKGKQKRK